MIEKFVFASICWWFLGVLRLKTKGFIFDGLAVAYLITSFWFARIVLVAFLISI
jgi:hypothetical protein